MISSDFRLEARQRLAGKWGKVACISLAYWAIFIVLGFLEGFIAGLFNISEDNLFFTLINYIIEIPLAFGYIISLYKVYSSEDVKAFDFFTLGFQNFGKSWGIAFRTVLKLIVPFILIIVSSVLISFGIVASFSAGILGDSSYSSSSSLFALIGIILYISSLVWLIVKGYYYQLAYVIAADEPTLTPKEAVDRSKELMTGNRGKLFGLQFSFIGWAILAALTFGIGMLWLLPYIQFATFAFYHFVARKDSPEVIAEETTNN